MNDLFDADLPPFNQAEDNLFGWDDADSTADAVQSPLVCINVDEDRQYSRGRRSAIHSSQTSKVPTSLATKQVSNFLNNQTIPEHQAAPAIPSDAPSLQNQTNGTPQACPNRSSLDSVMSYASNMNIVDGFIQPPLQAMSPWPMPNAGISVGDMGAVAMGYQGIVPGAVPQMQAIGYGMQPFNNFNSVYNKQQVEQYMGSNQDRGQRTRLSEDSVVSNTQFWSSMPSQGGTPGCFNPPNVHHMPSHDMNGHPQKNAALQSSFFSPSQAFQQPAYNYAQGAPQGGMPAVNVQPNGMAMGGLAPADVQMGSGPIAVPQQQENSVAQVDAQVVNGAGLVGTARISLDSSVGGGSSSRRSVDQRQPLDSAGGRSKGYFKQSAAQKEKMRRDKFSSLIGRLRSLVPPSGSVPNTHSNQYCTDQRPKNAVLMDAIHYIEQLQGVQQEGKATSEGMRSEHLTSVMDSDTSQQPDSKLSPTSSLKARNPPTATSLEVTKASETSTDIVLACPSSPQLLADLSAVATGLGLAVRKCNVNMANNGMCMVDCRLEGNMTDTILESLNQKLKGLLLPK